MVLVKQIESLILVIREQRVMLDSDLAALYGVPTRVLNQAVKRNRDRFPEDFMFQLTKEEKAEVITNCDHLAPLKFSPSMPYAFTEHGAIMAANVLNSPRAIQASVYVVRAFVTLREALITNREVARKLADLEQRVDSHDQDIKLMIAAIRNLMKPPPKDRPRIGFKPGGEK